MLVWSKALSVDVPEMDEQHRRWIDLINQLEWAMTEGRGNDVIEAVSIEVFAFTKVHFADEEALLAARGYPTLEAHKALHRAFLAQLETIGKSAGLKSYRTAQTLNHLKGWLLAHVMEHDKAYGAFLNGAG